MRLKFNRYENNLLKEAIQNIVEKKEKETEERIKQKKNLVYGKGYFNIIGEEIINRIDKLTLKKHL